MRYPILFLLLSLALGAAPVQFDLPAQPVAVSLVAFAKQAGVEVLFASADLRDVRANAVNGRHEPEEALALLLRGTGFTASRNRAGKFVIVRERVSAPLSAVEVRGSVVAADGGRPVVGAEVRVAGSAAERATTGADGTFTLAAVPATADAALLIAAENFAPVRVTALGAQAGRAVALRPVRLAAAPAGDAALELGEISVNASELGAGLLALQKVVVTPSRFGIDEERGPLAATLTEADLQALPQLGEDVYRAISHLPGLAAQDTTARFWVRGAPNDRVLARLDGADLLEPFHLKDTDSALSILDLQSISRLNLWTGGFTTEFGDRLAGVLTMESESHTRARPSTTLGASLTGFRVAHSGRSENGRSRWLVSARSGFPDLALRATGTQGVLKPRYEDAMGKWEFDLAPGHTLSLHALHGGDRLFLRDANGSVLKSRYGSDYFWARWQGEFGERVTGEAVLSRSQLTWRRDGNGVVDRALPFELRDARQLDVTTLRQDWTAGLSPHAMLKGGLEFKSADADYDYHSFRDRNLLRNGVIVTERQARDQRLAPGGRALGAYFSTRVQPVEGLTLEPGVRYDENNYAHDSEVSPRFNAAYARGRTTWRAAWGVYAQSQGLHELALQDGDALFRRAERAEHRVLSVEHRFEAGLNLRVEGYERLVTHPRPHWENALDALDVFPEIQFDRFRLDPARQTARGVELIAERRGVGKFSWSASYALAKTEETLADGRTLPRSHDQRHTVYLDASWTPSPRWQFSAAWQYHTGWPTSSQVFSLVPLASGALTVNSRLGPLYAERLADYHRLDLRVQRRFETSRGTVRLYLDVFNAYDRKNSIGNVTNFSVVNGQLSTTRRPDLNQLPILPSVGATWEF